MDVVPVEHSLYLCPIPSDQPAKGCEALSSPGTKNESMPSSILRHGSCWPAPAQLFESRTSKKGVVVGSDSTSQ